MKKFNYMVRFPTEVPDDQWLLPFGNDGWELVSIFPYSPKGKQGGFKCYFKREL